MFQYWNKIVLFHRKIFEFDSSIELEHFVAMAVETDETINQQWESRTGPKPVLDMNIKICKRKALNHEPNA